MQITHNKPIKSLLTTLIVLITVPFNLQAQNRQERVTIIGTFEPSLRPVEKIFIDPAQPEPLFNNENQNFSRISGFYQPKTTSAAIAVNQVRTDEKSKRYANHLKTGIGTQLSPLFLYRHHSKLSKNTAFSLELNHRSSWLDIPEYAPSTWMKNAAIVNLEAAIGDHIWNNKLGYSHDQFHFYGFKPSEYVGFEIDKKNLQQQYHRLNFESMLTSNYSSKSALHHELSLGYKQIADKHQNTGQQVLLHGNAGKYFDWFGNQTEQYASALLDINFFNEEDSLNGNRGYQSNLNPSLTFSGSFFSLKAGLLLSTVNDDSTRFYLYPQLKGSLFVFDQKLEFYASLDGNQQLHSLYETTLANPWLSPGTSHWWSNTTKNIRAGVKIGLIPNTDFHLGVNYNETENGGFFITDFEPVFQNSMKIIHDNYNRFRFQGDVTYQHSDKVRSYLQVFYDQYRMNSFDHAWHQPAFHGKAGTILQVIDRWRFGAEILFEGERFTPDSESLLARSVRLKPWVDVNLSAAYQIMPQFEVFTEINNLTGNRYEKFYRYPVQGLQLFGGISLQF